MPPHRLFPCLFALEQEDDSVQAAPDLRQLHAQALPALGNLLVYVVVALEVLAHLVEHVVHGAVCKGGRGRAAVSGGVITVRGDQAAATTRL